MNAGQSVCALLVFALIASCAKPEPDPAQPSTTQPAAPSPDSAAPVPPPEQTPPPEDSATGPAQPTPDDPLASAPSLARSATSNSQEPGVETMLAAVPSGKMTIAVGLRYALSGDPATGPMTLSLAAIPRVAGTNLNVSVKSEPGIKATTTPMRVEKATVSGIYRKQMSLNVGPEVRRIRVLVTMDIAEGTGFGFFSIPLDGGINPQKLDSVKQH
jgi:hypothetical protein